jgi:hypothetical protein
MSKKVNNAILFMISIRLLIFILEFANLIPQRPTFFLRSSISLLCQDGVLPQNSSQPKNLTTIKNTITKNIMILTMRCSRLSIYHNFSIISISFLFNHRIQFGRRKLLDKVQHCHFSAAFPSLFFRVIPQV